jgi:integrase
MIERQNYLDVKAFIKYQDEAEQKDGETLRNYWIALKHLLQWADDTPFPLAGRIKPTFPVYIMATSARNDGEYQPAKVTRKPLALAMQEKVITTARMFFTWARMEYQAQYRPITLSWIADLKPSRRAVRDGAKMQTVEAWELSDVLKVAGLTDEDMRISRLDGKELDELSKPGKFGRLDLALLRAQAAICFLYLSGMRITAFLSLPVSCVDLAENVIEQLPEKGVQTKFRKSAITALYNIPEIMKPVARWDALVRSASTGGRWCRSVGRWGTNLSDDGMLDPSKMRAKRGALIDGMKKVCALAGVPYKSPHKLRHGNAKYGVEHAKTFADFKAVSQNLMHESTSITDGIYGTLTHADTRKLLAGLTAAPAVNQPAAAPGPGFDLAALIAQLQALQAAQNVGLTQNPSTRGE